MDVGANVELTGTQRFRVRLNDELEVISDTSSAAVRHSGRE